MNSSKIIRVNKLVNKSVEKPQQPVQAPQETQVRLDKVDELEFDQPHSKFEVHLGH